jgi:hypothetical protein
LYRKGKSGDACENDNEEMGSRIRAALIDQLRTVRYSWRSALLGLEFRFKYSNKIKILN